MICNNCICFTIVRMFFSVQLFISYFPFKSAHRDPSPGPSSRQSTPLGDGLFVSRRFAPIDVAAPRAVRSPLLLNADIPLALQLVERALDGGDAELEIARHALVADVAEFVFPLPVEEIAVNGNGFRGHLVHVDHFERSHSPPFCAISRASLNV